MEPAEGIAGAVADGENDVPACKRPLRSVLNPADTRYAAILRLKSRQARTEADFAAEEAAYAQDMFETIFRDYRQEKDDYFSEKMQRDLIRLMHEPRIAYVSGGHLTTVLQAEKFIETIRAFLPSLGSNADRREWQ